MIYIPSASFYGRKKSFEELIRRVWDILENGGLFILDHSIREGWHESHELSMHVGKYTAVTRARQDGEHMVYLQEVYDHDGKLLARKRIVQYLPDHNTVVRVLEQRGFQVFSMPRYAFGGKKERRAVFVAVKGDKSKVEDAISLDKKIKAIERFYRGK